MNIELLTYEIAMRSQELQQEAEQERLLVSLRGKQYAVVRHTLALCGVVLVKVGMKLKQMEMQGEPQTI